MKRTMVARVEAYLAHRRALGYKMRTEGRMLLNFARAADLSGHRGPLTRKLALHWAALPRQADRLYHARRLEVVRGFAQHQIVFEPATEIPPRHVYGPAHCRKPPHLYCPAQIHQLLRRATQLPGRLRPLTYHTLLGLLACTGLRISEALALSIRDVDWVQGVLTVQESKYRQTRLVPVHPSALPSLQRYAQRRQALFPLAQHFFVSDRGNRFAYTTVRTVFRKLAHGLVSTSGRRFVRLHDLRHTFACRVLQRWQRSKRGATGRVVILSRYLGHVHVNDTYWYLTAAPELLAEAARLFEPAMP